jgi:uncharacterized protein DUF3854
MLTDDHRAYLRGHAITDEVIDSEGVLSDGEEYIVFTWRDGDNQTFQRKVFPGGKYLWETGKDLHFNVLRDHGSGPVLIQEGTKQSLAALSWAPEELSIFGMAGCAGASKVPLKRFKGRQVYVCLDADASSNPQVYEAGEKLASRLAKLRVSVTFLQLPIEGEEGMDDYLAELEPGQRTDAIRYELEHATSKVSAKRPPAKKAPANSGTEPPDTKGRALVVVNDDIQDVITGILTALKEEWDGKKLFNYGSALTAVKGYATDPLEEGPFIRLVSEVVALMQKSTGNGNQPDRYAPGRMDTQTMKAVRSAAEEFAELRRLVRVPFVRPDGTVCTEPGYDSETRTVLVPDEDVRKIEVPEDPTPEQVASARDLLLTEWLGDIPFSGPSARANALALVLTPLVRGMFELAPLAVVDGLQMGVGKNLFADCVSILATGQPCVPMPYTRDDDETRKQITATFRSGAEMFVFDEAHVIEGASLARALTSITYQDRILGLSKMAEFPNQVTWMSLGNNVSVNGDCSRRVYWIALRPEGANPQDRSASSFRHPDLKEWTRKNRAALVTAALTLVRAWFVAGKPRAERGTSLGSFEAWDHMVGGIVAHAGVEGFLAEIQEKRSESDFEGAYWRAHVMWLRETFGQETFTTADVKSHAVRSPATYEAPPNMEDPGDKGYTRRLGQRYASIKDRWYEGIKLTKAGMGHRSTLKWAIVGHDLEVGREVEGTPKHSSYGQNSVLYLGKEGKEGKETRFRVQEPGREVPSLTSVTSRQVLVGFDLETRSVDQLWSEPDPSFIRIAGEVTDDADH